MRTRIGTRLILGAGLIFALTISLLAWIIVRAHQSDMIAELERSASQLSETIESSTYHDMLENRRDSLKRQIETIGRQSGIEEVRLFNKDGVIVFGSDAAHVGRRLDTRDGACIACHVSGQPPEALSSRTARSRIFTVEGGRRLLGTISPIQNQPACSTAACHAHDPAQRVLGVLDVTVSLAEVDRAIRTSRLRIAALALLGIAASSLTLGWLSRRLVLRPVAALTAGTRRVAAGDLTTTIPSGARHELGELAGAFNEMTRRLAEAQQKLTQADKLASVGRLAAGVAHEINNPLTGVLTYASFLLKRADGQPQLKEDLEVIVRETKRCREIVKGLLDFSRQTPPHRQPADLGEVARRAIAVVTNQLALNHVSLELDLADDLPRVPMDANQIQQVVVNLLVNAADAIGGSGSSRGSAGSGGFDGSGGTISLATRRARVAPWGHAPIRGARCPKGCDLADPSVRIGGLPAIQVLRTIRGRTAPVRLDPIYGRFNHQAVEPCEDGAILPYACPSCRVSLTAEGPGCRVCGAPCFAVQVPGRGSVLWCSRKGCHQSLWEAEEATGPREVAALTVRDSGHGIPPADLAHLFEPFFSTKGTRGTGLGLAITWGIVEGHGGTIEVESELGKGTQFTIRLPIDAAAGATTPSARAAAMPVPWRDTGPAAVAGGSRA